MANNTQSQNQTIPPTHLFKFRGIHLTFYEIDNKPWITARQLSKALGCFNHNRTEKLYHQFKSFFDASMTKMVKAQAIGLEGKEALLFSEQGAINIAMIARTDASNFFLHWISQTLRSFKDKQGYEFQPLNPKYQVSASLFKAIHEVLEMIIVRLDTVTGIELNHQHSRWLRDKLVDEAKREIRVLSHGLYAKQYPGVYETPYTQDADVSAKKFQKIEDQIILV
ncbi:MAG: hypothetical protein IPP74_04690 [Alphaproteobacteria bacterium]|nr:hypothetical protein [Alphaproteobacteria bacterium]